MHTTYCLTYAFAGFRTKRIELTFLKCFSHKSLLTREESNRCPDHEEHSLIKLRRRTQGYILALENFKEAEEYHGRDHEQLLTLTVEELVAYAIHAGVSTINHANKPIFQQRDDRPNPRPECVSHFLPGVIRSQRWSVLDSLATDLFYGRVCCTEYTIYDEPEPNGGRELTRLARILLEDWHEEMRLDKFSPAPRRLAVYPVYRKKCLEWGITPLTDAYLPKAPRASSATVSAPAATVRAPDDRSREVEVEGRRSTSAHLSDRTTSQPRRPQVYSSF